jgi:hypothetical protein
VCQARLQGYFLERQRQMWGQLRTVLGAGAALCAFSGTALAACNTPTAPAGALEWFTADTAFRYCDGGTWQLIGSGGLWTQNGTDLYYTAGSAGIGVTDPASKLEVNGSIKLGDEGAGCSGTTEGALRYVAASKTVDFCDGTDWRQMGGQAISTCAIAEYTSAGDFSYTILSGCETIQIEAYGAGGGAGRSGYGAGAGGSSRVETVVGNTVLALGGGGGGGGSGSVDGGGGGGGYGKATVTLTAGDNLLVVVGSGGQNGCNGAGGPGGSPTGGGGGNAANGGNSTYGGAGGGFYGYRGGNSTYGGGGGAGYNTSNSSSTTTEGGAGGADPTKACGTSTNGGACGGVGEGGGGGRGLGDIALTGLSGDRYGGGQAANGGPGDGAAIGSYCPNGGSAGKVVIRPM